jgi:predicted nucleic acid-binding protein
VIVVADSSPLNYLILIEQTAVLHRLYGSVLVPAPVAVELRETRAPQQVRDWMGNPPSWIEVVEVSDYDIGSVSGDLDRGERAAIALAERIRADLILIDETDGRIEALRRSLRVTGTLGVLRAAAGEGLIDVRAVLNRLAATNFYADEQILSRLFEKWLKERCCSLNLAQPLDELVPTGASWGHQPPLSSAGGGCPP